MMKTRTIGVALLALLGLTGSYQLIRKPLLNEPKDMLKVHHNAQIQPASVAAPWVPPDPSPADDRQTLNARKPKLKMVSSVDSLKISTVEEGATKRRQRFSVTGLAAKQCNVYVAVFESESGFPNSELSTETVVVSTNGERVEFSLELPTNRPLAIAVFQDNDGNGKLTKSQMGIPREPYGFSNNARGILGPPKFKQAAFELEPRTDNTETIEIKVR
jgi:uncharacterized protein (DUF2141 family)